MAAGMGSSKGGKHDTTLRVELLSLHQYIERFRKEIAEMVARDDNGDRFSTMAEQLDAIVAATENATDTILERMEEIDAIGEKLRAADDAKARAGLCDALNAKTMEAIEACTFQDITGQRVTKIVRSMKFVEDRVNAIMALWGKDEIERLSREAAKHQAPAENSDEALLNGPALDSEAAISQDEIDKLFD